jgi:UDP-N-acetylmuramoylalanine--D-glutamate ligase
MDYCKLFRGKRITLMGLGLLGRGVGDAVFLAACGASVLVTDMKNERELAESVEKLRVFPNITLHLGGHREEDFTHADMIIKAAGVPLDSSYIRSARENGVPVYMSTALFAKYTPAIVVGVTGTRGKSTVAHMIYHTLSLSNPITKSKSVHLGGNIRGVSTLAMLPETKEGDIAVLELDSWQLQGFGDFHISPRIAVFTNLFPDHLNYYADMDAYFADKANIFRHQKEGDILIAGSGIQERIQSMSPVAEPVMPDPIPGDWQLVIPGEHNRENAALAAAALRALGVSEDDIRAGLESFPGVPGRLELVATIGGVRIYNDTNATTPEATIAALRALSSTDQNGRLRKSAILIMGGADKGLDMTALVREVKDRCKAVILLAGSGTDRIKDDLPSDAVEYQNLSDAVEAAVEAAEPGDVVLFSPAFASFGMFKNEYERGDRFNEIVKKQARS